MAELSEEYQVNIKTMDSWKRRDGWDAERDARESYVQLLSKTLSFYADPDVEVGAMAEGNLKLLLKIQGISLAHVYNQALNGVPVPGLGDLVQKYSAALEKLNNTKQKIDTGGVQQSQVHHVHHVDMDQALQIALQARKTGQILTIEEAAQALAEQQKKSNTDGK